MMQGTPLFDKLFTELVTELDRYRDVDSVRIATALLEGDTGTELIGLLDGGDAVLNYDSATWTVTRTPILADSLDGANARVVDRLRTDEQLWRTVGDFDEDAFVWIHPRFRWLFEPPYADLFD
ncbi:hypothetical protein [Haladaptatus salinisoli]|uniref:hypothetical protein n=1 Tax=Haladaptatus salinisoli TaxID=2884876 RepID=UPI001D09E7EE|nr:hypothetical protein [Haladaptatus salinisoli]